MNVDIMNEDEAKKIWLATRHCDNECKLKFSCGSTSEYETGERLCPAFFDKYFTEKGEHEKEIKLIFDSKKK